MSDNFLDDRQMVQRAVLPMVGNTVNATLDTVFPQIDAELSKLFEDRNILLTDGGSITFTGTALSFTEALKISLNQKVSGAVPQVISLGSTTRTFTNSGDMLVAVLNRTAGTAVVSIIPNGSALPSAVAANQEVFLIAKRVDAADGTQRVYFRSGTALNAGQTVRLGSSGSGNGGTINYISNPDAETGTLNWSGYNENKAAIFTNGSPTVGITSNTGYNVGQRISFTTTGAVPTNFAINTTYYVVSLVSTTGLTVSATQAGAAISAGSAGSGTHTLHPMDPITGTGGALSGLTFTASAVAPLRGLSSFSLVQTNSTVVQGQGVSIPFTIDPADEAHVLGLSFNYNASSTFVTSNGTSDSDLEVFVYDITNARLISVSPHVITANGANNFTFTSTFQAAANSVNYRLIIHAVTSDANATGWTFKFDNVSVGPTPIILSATSHPATTQILTVSGTYTAPAGISHVKVTVVGGGGGGSGNSGVGNGSGGGGGGGGTAIVWLTSSSLGASQTFTVGTGGAGDTASTAGSGTASSFGTAPLCSASGGTGGESYSVDQDGQGGAGGIGSVGTLLIGGGAGSHGSSQISGEGSGSGGSGGNSTMGGGGKGSDSANGSSPAQVGQNYGGGGGAGGSFSASGAAGAPGVIVVEEYYSTISPVAIGAITAPTQQIFTTSGTYTAPIGTTPLYVKVTVIGGGGGGGTGSTGGGGGGGGGGASISWIPLSSISAGIAVTVGVASSAGSAGNTSSFGSLLSATGGGAGGSNTVSSAVGGAGGIGSIGTLNIQGGDGEVGGFEVIGTQQGEGGTGGSSILGGGGTGCDGISTASSAGHNYGGGGGGGNGGFPGAGGAPGVVIVEEYYANNASVNGNSAATQVDNPASGSAETIDWNIGNAQKVSLTASCILTFINPVKGTAYVLLVVQPPSGGPYIVTWPGTVKWSNGTPPPISAAANKIDLFNFYYDGTSFLGSYSLNY